MAKLESKELSENVDMAQIKKDFDELKNSAMSISTALDMIEKIRNKMAIVKSYKNQKEEEINNLREEVMQESNAISGKQIRPGMGGAYEEMSQILLDIQEIRDDKEDWIELEHAFYDLLLGKVQKVINEANEAALGTRLVDVVRDLNKEHINFVKDLVKDMQKDVNEIKSKIRLLEDRYEIYNTQIMHSRGSPSQLERSSTVQNRGEGQ